MACKFCGSFTRRQDAYNKSGIGRCLCRDIVDSASKNSYMRTYNQELKSAALKAYGEICQCCGESWPVFLTIDHIDGQGAAHRKSIGSTVYLWLRQNGYPKGFQVLCFNCNFAKHVKKVCPHQSASGRES